MAISQSIFTGRVKKSAGNVTAKVLNGQVVLSQKITSNNSKTYRQTKQRMAFRWTSLMAQLMKPVVDHSFVNRRSTLSSYNTFFSSAIEQARAIYGPSASMGQMNEFPFAPSAVKISSGNLAGLSYSITATGTTAQNVVSTITGIQWGVTTQGQNLEVGEMESDIFVLHRNDNSTIMVWRRIVRTGESTFTHELSPMYNTYLQEDSANTGRIIGAAGATVVAVASIRSRNAFTSEFDCSTAYLAVIPETQLRLVYGGESLLYDISVKKIADITDADMYDALINDGMGWPVDPSQLLAPASLGYYGRSNENQMGDGVVSAE